MPPSRHMPLAQAACAPSLSSLAGPVGPRGSYGSSPRSTALREGTSHLLIHRRDEWISGEPSQLPQALSARSPDRWEPIGKASCDSPHGRRESGYKIGKRGKHAFKNTRTRFGRLLRLSSTKPAALEERAGLLQHWFTCGKMFHFCLNLQLVGFLTDDTCFHQN